jgi:hypothetical protein
MNAAYYKYAEKFLLSFGLTVITGLIDNTPTIMDGGYLEFEYSLN